MECTLNVDVSSLLFLALIVSLEIDHQSNRSSHFAYYFESSYHVKVSLDHSASVITTFHHLVLVFPFSACVFESCR